MDLPRFGSGYTTHLNSLLFKGHRIDALCNGKLVDNPQPCPVGLPTDDLGGHAAILLHFVTQDKSRRVDVSARAPLIMAGVVIARCDRCIKKK